MSGCWYAYPSEKYEFVSWGYEIPNIWKNKKCCKPPTRCCLDVYGKSAMATPATQTPCIIKPKQLSPFGNLPRPICSMVLEYLPTFALVQNHPVM